MTFTNQAITRQEEYLQAALRVAQTCDYETEHSEHVTRLSLRLFDETQQLHQLGQQERLWLNCAAILHDIGWIEGRKSHNKISLRIILSTNLLPFNNRERLIIGSIARYHRKALPTIDHDHFAALVPEDQTLVKTLSALLRLADGLDQAHIGRVYDLTSKITPKKIILYCRVNSNATEEDLAALYKKDLFEQVFTRSVIFKWEYPKSQE
jgi:exopolyphosphatase/guanosine-5'-triphosphate,3'-diphosphate pyrophosphatase